MMKTRLTKILVAALAAVILIASAIGIGVAAENEPNLNILSKNLSYGSNFRVAFAVDNTGVGADQEIEVLLYAEDPALNPDAEVFKAVKSEKVLFDDTYPVYYSYGIPAKDLTAYVWAQAHIVGTDVYGKVYRYSALEYLYERLYVQTNELTDAQKKLYNTVLTYCADAQAVLTTTSPAIGDLRYVHLSGGTLDGVNYSALYKSGDDATLTYKGDDSVGWLLQNIDGEGNTSAGGRLADGASVTIGASHIVATTVPSYNFEKENVLDSFTITANEEAPFFGASVADDPAPDYDGDKALLVSQLYKSGVSSGGSVVVPSTGDVGNCYVFTYDIYWDRTVTNSAGTGETTTGNGGMLQFNFKGGSGSAIRSNLQYAGKTSAAKYGYSAYFQSGNGSGAEAYQTISGNLYDDRWYNVRLEIYSLGATAVTKYFLDDVFVGLDESYNSNAWPLTAVSIETRNNNTDVYLDNISLVRTQDEYVAPADTITGSPAGNGKYFNDQNKVGTRADFTTKDSASHGITLSDNLLVPLVVDSNYHFRAFASRIDIDGGYGFVKANGVKGTADSDRSYVRYSTGGLALDSSVEQFTVVEMDAAFGGSANTDVFAIIRGAIPAAQNNRSDIYIGGTADGKIKIGTWCTLLDGAFPILEQSMWYNLRFEFYKDGSIKMYVDGDYTGTIQGADFTKANYSAVDLTLHQYADDEWIAYDNFYLGYDTVTE